MRVAQLTTTTPDDSTTKAELIHAALRHFGEDGYDTASLRSIVSDAGQNISSIKYHFGSKEGLYDACVVTVARRISFEGPGAMLDSIADDPHSLTPENARSAIRVIIGAVIRDAHQPESRSDTKFMRREILLGGRGADLFLREVLGVHIDLMAALLCRAEDLPPESPAARLRALGIIGQTTFFLTADILTKKAMGWDRLSNRVPELIDAIYPMQRNPKALA